MESHNFWWRPYSVDERIAEVLAIYVVDSHSLRRVMGDLIAMEELP